MSKEEFISILTDSLQGEIPKQDIENNINYYNQYITDDTKLELLGNPRLIAKTIIDSYKTSAAATYSRNRGRNTDGYEDGNYSYNHERYDSEQNHKSETENTWNINNSPIEPIPWYYKLIGIILLVLLLIVIVAIGGVILSFAFTVLLPVLLVTVIVKIIIRGSRGR